MAFPGIPYDMWIDFEALGADGTLVTQANLNSSSHGVSSGWNITGVNGGIPTNSLLDSQASSSDGVSDGQTGSRGMRYTTAAGTAGVVEYVFPARVIRLSFGLAYKTTTAIPSFGEGPHFINVYDGGLYGSMMRLSDEKDGGDNTRQIRISPGVAPSRVAVSDGTWYWLTCFWESGGLDKLKVYDTSLNLVGSATWLDTFTGSTASAIQLGSFAGQFASAVAVSFDNFVLDTTFARFPLIPTTGFGVPTFVSVPQRFRSAGVVR